MRRYVALLKVVEVGSFTKAAELLGYTQPALSQMIASLEKELSIKLLRRSRQGIRLTPEGERLCPAVREAVARYEAMRRAADEIRGLEAGIVRIGTVSSVSAHWLPKVIHAFWQDHPGVQVELRQGDYTSIAEWIRTGEVDFGFVNPAAVKGLETARVKAGEFRAVVPTGHPLTTKGSVTLEELARQPLLLLEEGAYSEPMEAFREAGLAPNIKMRAHDDYTLLSMVEEELGVTVLAELVLRKTSYSVATLPIEPAITREMAVAAKDLDALPLASKAFIEYLMERTGELA